MTCLPWVSGEAPFIAILRGIEPHEVVAHAEALVEAGFEAFEIPLNTPKWEESLPLVVKAMGKRACVGAGTVLETRQVDTLSSMGVQFIVSPCTHPDVIAHAGAKGLMACPGCMTPTEALTAFRAGADVLKIFPADFLGPSYLRALKTVLPPHLSVLAVGGMKPEAAWLKGYLDAGCSGFGLGGCVYKPQQTVQRTREKAEIFVKAYREARAL